MMGRLNRDQKQLFYGFCLDEVVPEDHLVLSAGLRYAASCMGQSPHQAA
jgi:hypothetical protein